MEETQKILEEIQKKTYQGILWAIFWSAGLVSLLTAGILLNTPGISQACIGLIYPAGVCFLGLFKLMKAKKEVLLDQSSATGSSSSGTQPATVTGVTCSSSQSIRVQALTEPYFRGALAVVNNFVGSGRKPVLFDSLDILPHFPLRFPDFLRNEESALFVRDRYSGERRQGRRLRSVVRQQYGARLRDECVPRLGREGMLHRNDVCASGSARPGHRHSSPSVV